MILRETTMGAGEPLVLLHGLFGRGRNFGVVQRRLAARFRVMALDLRNHGDSPRDPHMEYPAMAADVLETLAAANALPCHLLGHSLGGKVAMAAALARPDAVRRLIVADIAPVRYPPHFRTIIAAMRAMDLPPNMTRAAADRALADAVPDAAMRGFLLQNLLTGATPAWRIPLDVLAAALDGIAQWPVRGSYPGPTLFLAGGRSDYVLAEHRAAIRTQFPAAEFQTLPAAGHWLHADDPDGFVTTVTAFLI